MKIQKLVAKILTGVLFGLLILSFAVWGIGDIFRGGGQVRAVAEVGDVQIDQHNYGLELRREQRRLSQRFGSQLEPQQLRLLGIDREVLRSMIARALIESEAGTQGLAVPEAQIKQRIAEEELFRDQFDAFDPARFRQFLDSAGYSEQTFVHRLRGEIQSQRIAGGIADAVVAPESLARRIHAYENERRVAQYIRLPLTPESEVGEPDEEALNAFYDQNAATFMTPPFRAVTFIQLRPVDVAAEIAVAEEMIVEEFESRREEFGIPERRAVEQMIFNSEAEAQAAFERLSEGAEFTAVAEESTGQPPIPLGMTDGSGLLPALRDAAFALESGGASEPFESPLGWHIVRVTDIEPAVEPELEELRDQLRDEVALREAVDSIVALANELDDQIGGGASLEEAADALGLQARQIEAIDRQGNDRNGEPIADLPSPDVFVPEVLNTPVGETSLMQETDDGGYFIVRVDSTEDARQLTLEEVTERVAGLWRQSEQTRLTQEKAQEMADRLKEGRTLEALAEDAQLAVEESEPLTRDAAEPEAPAPRFAANIFTLDTGEVTTMPVADGFLIVRLAEIIPVSESDTAADFEATNEALTQSMRADLFDLYLASLQADIGVRVNQVMLDEVLESY